MRLLVDTHCWLWLQAAPERFRPEVIELLSDTRNDLLLSAASSWEIAIKHALGKLALPAPPQDYVPSRMQQCGTVGLAIEHAHVLRIAQLPMHHRDPFDRVLVAQAQLEQLTLLTADSAFDAYDVKMMRP